MRQSTSFITILAGTIKRHRYFLGWCWYIYTCYSSPSTLKNFPPFIHSSWSTLARLTNEEKSLSSVSKSSINWHNGIKSLHLYSTPLLWIFLQSLSSWGNKALEVRTGMREKRIMKDWQPSWKSDWLYSKSYKCLKYLHMSFPDSAPSIICDLCFAKTYKFTSLSRYSFSLYHQQSVVYHWDWDFAHKPRSPELHWVSNPIGKPLAAPWEGELPPWELIKCLCLHGWQTHLCYNNI